MSGIVDETFSIYCRPSVWVRKKMENYVVIFSNIKWTIVTIMWKRRQFMRKFLK